MNALTNMMVWLSHHHLFSAAVVFLGAAVAVTLYTYVQDGTRLVKEGMGKRAC